MVVTICCFAVKATLVTAATMMTISSLLPVIVVNAHQAAASENIPNPRISGEMTIRSGLYPD